LDKKECIIATGYCSGEECEELVEYLNTAV
jgi:hypothetical protein